VAPRGTSPCAGRRPVRPRCAGRRPVHQVPCAGRRLVPALRSDDRAAVHTGARSATRGLARSGCTERRSVHTETYGAPRRARRTIWGAARCSSLCGAPRRTRRSVRGAAPHSHYVRGAARHMRPLLHSPSDSGTSPQSHSFRHDRRRPVQARRMTNSPQLGDWRDEFVLARDMRAFGRTAELVREVRGGALTPVIRGVYRHSQAATDDLQRAGDDAFLARVRATQLLNPEPLVYTGYAAAAIWGLPVVGGWPNRVQVTTPPAAGGRSSLAVARSHLGNVPGEPVVFEERDGLRVVSLARTVVDIGRTATFGQAVAVTDAALAGQAKTAWRAARFPVTKDQLRDELSRLRRAAGSMKCQTVLEFANGASGSPGESVSRAGIHLLGFPRPQLQVRFTDSDGLIGIVDFWWPETGLIGEFDGYGKYLRDEFTSGRPADQIVMDEKRRENRLRALGPRMSRWGWSVAWSLPSLRTQLEAAGLRPEVGAHARVNLQSHAG
jgi:hypothetical protein